MAKHPTELADGRSRFDTFAEAASRFVSDAAFFTISAIPWQAQVPDLSAP